MKKTTQKLFNFAMSKIDYYSDKLELWNYLIRYCYGACQIKKWERQIGVVDNNTIFINSALERFLFNRAVEKNIGEIVDLIKETEERKEKNAREEYNKLKEKNRELEEKLASAVAEKVDLDLNQTD